MDDTCYLCPQDSYSDTLSNAVCTLCVEDDPNTVNLNTGSTSASDCGKIIYVKVPHGFQFLPRVIALCRAS